jgi:hypothetical protein
MKKYILFFTMATILNSCKKDSADPGIESPFVVRYSIEASSPFILAGAGTGVNLIDQNGLAVNYAVNEIPWNQSFTIINTQRPLSLHLKSIGGLPFHFNSPATLKASIYVNESLVATVTKQSTVNIITDFELNYIVK